MKAFQQYPRLDDAQVPKLIALAQSGNKNARDTLILSNMKLVLSIATPYVKYAGSLTLDDLLQEGSIGLGSAIDKFDLTKNTKFSTYATPRIFQAIQRAIEDKAKTIRIPSHLEITYKRYKKFIASYEMQEGQTPSDELVISTLKISEETLDTLQGIYQTENIDSIDRTLGTDDDRTISEMTASKVNDYNPVDNDIDQNILLYACSVILHPKQYYVLYQRIFQSPSTSLEEIAQQLNLTRERIRQIENSAKEKIKQKLDNGRGELNTTKYIKGMHLSDIEKERLTPLSPIDIAEAYILRTMLVEEDYRVFYYLNIHHRMYTPIEVARKLYLSKSELVQSLHNINITRSCITEEEKKNTLNRFFTSQTTDQFLLTDLSPKPITLDQNKIEEITNFVQRHTLEELIQSIPEITQKQKRTLTFFFTSPTMPLTKYWIVCAQRELTLLFHGYKTKSRFQNNAIYKNAYADYQNEFSSDQQAIIEHYILKTISKKEMEARCEVGTKSQYVFWLKKKLETHYFGLNATPYEALTKESVTALLNNPKYDLTEEQRKLLTLSYGIGEPKAYSIGEIATMLQIPHNIAHDRIAKTKEIAEKMVLGIPTHKETENYDDLLPYLKDKRYPLTEETRAVLTEYILEKKTYAQIANEFHLSQNRVANIVLDGIRRLEMFQHRVVIPEAIQKAKRKLAIVTEEDYHNELNAHETDTVLTEKERIATAHLLGYQCKYNPHGKKMSRNEIVTKFHIIRTFDLSVSHKIALRKSGLLYPQFGRISSNELKEILKDPHLPISAIDRDVMIAKKGLNGKTKTDKEIQEETGFSPATILRRYQRATLQILRYLNKEIGGKLSWEYDVAPNLRYFSNYDAQILTYLYQEEVGAVEIARRIGQTRCALFNDTERINKKLYAILKYPNKKRFDYAAAREIIEKEDFPIYENKDLIVTMYKMYVGELGKPMTSTEIKEALKLRQGNTAILNAIQEVMLTVEYYKLGLRKSAAFTREDVKKYYKKHKDHISAQHMPFFHSYFRRVKRKRQLTASKSFISPTIQYLLLQEQGKEIVTLDSLTQEQAIKILKTSHKYLAKDAQRVIMTYFQIPYSVMLSGKEKQKVYRMLYPLYLKEKKEQALAKS